MFQQIYIIFSTIYFPCLCALLKAEIEKYRTCFEHVENIGIRFIESIDKQQTRTIFATHLQAFFVAIFATKHARH